MNLETLFFGAVILFCCAVAFFLSAVILVLSFNSYKRNQVPPLRSPTKPPPLKTDVGFCPRCTLNNGTIQVPPFRNPSKPHIPQPRNDT